jgi:hypothetical protein
MDHEQRAMVRTTVGLGTAFLLAIMGVCWAVAEIAAGLANWMASR